MTGDAVPFNDRFSKKQLTLERSAIRHVDPYDCAAVYEILESALYGFHRQPRFPCEPTVGGEGIPLPPTQLCQLPTQPQDASVCAEVPK
jgi:hypothetical protein